MSTLETHYAVSDIESRILDGLRAAGLDPEQGLSPEAIGALDHFHTGGVQASLELMELARVTADDEVLDIGAGLAGCARLLAASVGCRVDCLEMSADYCAGAALLNRLTGLEGQIKVHQGSALDLPFSDQRFEVVWMQNVGMNIADKQQLYREIARVLKPGGRFVFQEVAAGTVATSYFPLPWATEPADSLLISGDEMCAMLDRCGFATEQFEDISDNQFNRNSANYKPAPTGQLGLAVYVDDLATKAGNAQRSLEQDQIKYVRGVFRVNM